MVNKEGRRQITSDNGERLFVTNLLVVAFIHSNVTAHDLKRITFCYYNQDNNKYCQAIQNTTSLCLALNYIKWTAVKFYNTYIIVYVNFVTKF